MSQYTNYDSVCENYDHGRLAHGADKLLAQITRLTNKSPRDLHILDAGCGTGNYSKALLQLGVGKISMFDASIGMLRQAENKLRLFIDEGRVGELTQGMLPKIPFESNQFDAIMFNCVLHHLDTGVAVYNIDNNNSFPNVSNVFKEAHRVLKPGGLFTAITQLPEQYQGQWFVNLAPSVYHNYLGRFPDFQQYVSMTNTSGFTKLETETLLGADWFSEYYNPEGPLSKRWRDNDSFWSYLNEDELAQALQKVTTMKAEGTLEQFVQEHDGSLTKGHFTMLSAKKL